MNVTCDKCDNKFKVPNEKLPQGKSVFVKCPKCKTRQSLSRPASDQASEKQAPKGSAAFGFDEASGGAEPKPGGPKPKVGKYDASEKPFDFIEEEGDTALICEPDPTVRDKAQQVLGFMEYHLSEANDTRDALKKMRYHLYDLVIVNETFSSRSPDANGVLIYLERLNMKVRRKIFVILLTKRFKTLDQMTGFKKSVNLVININDVDHFEKIISRGLVEHNHFYRVFNEVSHSVGL